MDYSSLIEQRKQRFIELEHAIGDPDLFADPKRATETLREHRRLKETLHIARLLNPYDACDDLQRTSLDGCRLRT